MLKGLNPELIVSVILSTGKVGNYLGVLDAPLSSALYHNLCS